MLILTIILSFTAIALSIGAILTARRILRVFLTEPKHSTDAIEAVQSWHALEIEKLRKIEEAQTERLKSIHRCIELLQEQATTLNEDVRKLQNDTGRNATSIRLAHESLMELWRDTRGAVKAYNKRNS